VERELIISGIGGQGIQLAATILAGAAVAEGREVQVFGSYGGMMRGGATESTVIFADGPIEAPPTIATTWSAILMHHEHADHLLACLRPGTVVLVNDSVVPDQLLGEGCVVFRVPASDMATEVGNLMAASMVMIGAYAAATGLVGLSALVEASCASLPAYRAQHAALNERALRTGFGSLPAGSGLAWHDRKTALR
jgi:Pyruvate/2-oxoacid:ferredoxin oxidoreductase gamma subunit